MLFVGLGLFLVAFFVITIPEFWPDDLEVLEDTDAEDRDWHQKDADWHQCPSGQALRLVALYDKHSGAIECDTRGVHSPNPQEAARRDFEFRWDRAVQELRTEERKAAQSLAGKGKS